MLALYGGQRTIDRELSTYDPISAADEAQAVDVLRSRRLSGFMGAPGNAFYGGPRVRHFESQITTVANVQHAITCNSWTSGLLMSLLAAGVEPGDEVITTPWTMCATSAAIRQIGAIPRYVDISIGDFNLDTTQIPESVTTKTSAILAVDIFGKPSDRAALAQISDEYGLPVIVDAAQAPLMGHDFYVDNSRVAIWGYSFNYHKHIHAGEGGIALTNNNQYAEIMRRLRNHGEILGGTEDADLYPGYNFRLGEVECALLSGQLERLATLVRSRQEAAARISAGVSDLRGLISPDVVVGESHAYYILGFRLMSSIAGHRNVIVDALQAEGVPDLLKGYQNVHRLPAYANGGRLPVAEDLHDRSFVGLYMCGRQLTEDDCALIVAAFKKVWRLLKLEDVPTQ